jgi:hypothetical protein
MTTTPDFRELCAELLDELEWWSSWYNATDLKDRAPTALATPSGAPKNCWLDDEPDLCPSPCVFDDPSEVISNCAFAETVKRKTDCQYYRAATPPPEPPTDEELRKLWLDLYATNDGPTSGEVVTIARTVLERWGRA